MNNVGIEIMRKLDLHIISIYFVSQEKLQETKSAAEDRRAKSPAIQLPTKMTVDDELVLEDDDDEDVEGFYDEEDLKGFCLY